MKVKDIIERIQTEFIDDPRYKNSPKLLNVWLKVWLLIRFFFFKKKILLDVAFNQPKLIKLAYRIFNGYFTNF